MAKKVWRSLLDVTRSNEASGDLLLDQLAAAVADLNLAPAFLERLRIGVAEAVQRVRQHDRERAGRLTVAVLVLQVAGEPPAQAWGFFLVEKRQAQTADRRVEVRLYPEGHR